MKMCADTETPKELLDNRFQRPAAAARAELASRELAQWERARRAWLDSRLSLICGEPAAERRDATSGDGLRELMWILIESLADPRFCLTPRQARLVARELESAIRSGQLARALSAGGGRMGPKKHETESAELARITALYFGYDAARSAGENYYDATETVAEWLAQNGEEISAKTVRKKLTALNKLLDPSERKAPFPVRLRTIRRRWRDQERRRQSRPSPPEEVRPGV